MEEAEEGGAWLGAEATWRCSRSRSPAGRWRHSAPGGSNLLLGLPHVLLGPVESRSMASRAKGARSTAAQAWAARSMAARSTTSDPWPCSWPGRPGPGPWRCTRSGRTRHGGPRRASRPRHTMLHSLQGGRQVCACATRLLAFIAQ